MSTLEKKRECPTDSFDVAFRTLCRTMTEIKSETATGGSFDLHSKDPYWAICCGKIYSAYIQIDNPELFKPMFVAFYEKYRDELIQQISDEEGINDEWIKVREVLPHPGAVRSSKGSKSSRGSSKRANDGLSWSSVQSVEGHVLYYSDNEKHRAVSLPFTKAYLVACAHFVKLRKEKEICSSLPAQLLFSFYSAIYHICDEEDKLDIKNNVTNLKEMVAVLTPEESSESGALDPLKNIMKMFAKQTGLGGEGGDTSQMSNALTNIFTPEVSKKIGDVVTKVTDSIKKAGETTGADGKPNIDGVIGAIGNVFQSNEVQGMLKETVGTIANLQNSIPSVPAPETAAEAAIAADEQE